MRPRSLFAALAVALAVAIAAGAPSVLAQDAGPAPPTAPPTKEDGEKIWNDKKAKCATCHGGDGKGDTKMGKSKGVTDMTTAEWQKKHTDQQIIDSILKGVNREENGKKIKMEPMKGATQRDAEALLAFIRTLGPQ